MSAVKGVNKTLIDAAGGPAAFAAKGTYDANVKCIIDQYEASALASNSTIKMGGALPAGAKIVEILLTYDALSTVTLSVGDSDTAARYISAQSAASAGMTRLTVVDGLGYVIGTASGDNQIVISTTGASAATGTINIAILYTNA